MAARISHPCAPPVGERSERVSGKSESDRGAVIGFDNRKLSFRRRHLPVLDFPYVAQGFARDAAAPDRVD